MRGASFMNSVNLSIHSLGIGKLVSTVLRDTSPLLLYSSRFSHVPPPPPPQRITTIDTQGPLLRSLCLVRMGHLYPTRRDGTPQTATFAPECSARGVECRALCTVGVE